MLNKIALAALSTAVLVAPALAADRHSPEERLEKAIDGRVAGTPVRCLDLGTVGSTEIIERTAILYRVGSTVFVQRPRGGAESLRADDVLVTRINGGQLCRPETVELYDRASRGLRGFVSLGDFVPYVQQQR